MPDYKPTGKRYAEEYGVPWEVFEPQIQRESKWQQFRPDGHIVTSAAGALGLGQLMPDTARELGVNPMNPTENLRGAAMYDAKLLRYYNGDPVRALAAYNWGSGRVDHWNRQRSTLPAETRQYLDDILGPNWTGLPSGDQPPDGTTPEPDPSTRDPIIDFSAIRDWWNAEKSMMVSRGLGSGSGPVVPSGG